MIPANHKFCLVAYSCLLPVVLTPANPQRWLTMCACSCVRHACICIWTYVHMEVPFVNTCQQIFVLVGAYNHLIKRLNLQHVTRLPCHKADGLGVYQSTVYAFCPSLTYG